MLSQLICYIVKYIKNTFKSAFIIFLLKSEPLVRVSNYLLMKGRRVFIGRWFRAFLRCLASCRALCVVVTLDGTVSRFIYVTSVTDQNDPY
jgi:hypothetical protein